MILKLVLLSQAKCKATEFCLRESLHRIGRRPENELQIVESCVSGHHAEVVRASDGGYEIKDLDSSNGTFLNQEQVSSPMKIKAGDILRVGSIKLAVREHESELPPIEGGSQSADGLILFGEEEPLIEEPETISREEKESASELRRTIGELKAA